MATITSFPIQTVEPADAASVDGTEKFLAKQGTDAVLVSLDQLLSIMHADAGANIVLEDSNINVANFAPKTRLRFTCVVNSTTSYVLFNAPSATIPYLVSLSVKFTANAQLTIYNADDDVLFVINGLAGQQFDYGFVWQINPNSLGGEPTGRWYSTERFKTYKALLFQNGSEMPTATQIENTIGQVEYTRVSSGVYRLTCNGAFTNTSIARMGDVSYGAGQASYYNPIVIARIDDNTLEITTDGDNLINGCPIEVQVYDQPRLLLLRRYGFVNTTGSIDFASTSPDNWRVVFKYGANIELATSNRIGMRCFASLYRSGSMVGGSGYDSGVVTDDYTINPSELGAGVWKLQMNTLFDDGAVSTSITYVQVDNSTGILRKVESLGFQSVSIDGLNIVATNVYNDPNSTITGVSWNAANEDGSMNTVLGTTDVLAGATVPTYTTDITAVQNLNMADWPDLPSDTLLYSNARVFIQ